MAAVFQGALYYWVPGVFPVVPWYSSPTEIYWAGWFNGGFASQSTDPVRSDDPVCPELNDVAAKFVQIAYALEHPANEDAERVIVSETRKAAEAFLAGRPFPEWPGDADIKFD